MDGEIRVKGDRAFKLNLVSPGIYQIDLKQGEEVWLCPGEEKRNDPGPGGRSASPPVEPAKIHS
jgi:hypothetical protein